VPRSDSGLVPDRATVLKAASRAAIGAADHVLNDALPLQVLQHRFDEFNRRLKLSSQSAGIESAALFELRNELREHHCSPARSASLYTIPEITIEKTSSSPVPSRVHLHEPVSCRMLATVGAQGMKIMDATMNASALAAE